MVPNEVALRAAATAAAPGWPLADEPLPEDPLARWVYYARMAPSTHNTQPWKFLLGGNADAGEIDVIADESRWLRMADSDRRELYISMGCALESLRIAADFAGMATAVHYFPVERSTVVVARVRVQRGAEKREFAAPALLQHAVARRTSHRHFDPLRPVSDEQRRAIYSCFAVGDVSLHFVSQRAEVNRLAALESKADLALFADSRYREELAVWIGEGFLGTSWLISKIGQLAVARLPVEERYAEADANRLASAPLVALLTTRHDRAIDRVQVGEAYLRIALTAESRGLRVQPLSQILELPTTRAEAAGVFGLHDRNAQHLFRIGFADPEPPVQRRRPLGELIIRGSATS